MNAKPYLLGAALLAASLTSAYAGDQQRIQKSELPSAVQRAIDAAAVNAGSVKKITQQTLDGQVVYEVEFEKDDALNPRKRFTQEGRLLSGERDERLARDAARTGERPRAVGAAAADRSMATTNRERAETRREMRTVDTESMVKLESLPTAVRNAIQKEAAGREIVDIDEETQDGRKVYEVEFAQGGLNAQVHVAHDGTIVKADNNRGTSDPLTGIASWFAGTQLKDTPAAVQETIKREVRDGRIADIDKERRTGRVVYEVEVEGAENQFQLHIAEDGSIVKDDRVADAERPRTGLGTTTARREAAADRTVATTNRERAETRREMRTVDTESMLQLSSLPTAVRNAIQKEAAGREIVDIDEETQDGRKVYEVEFAQGGLNAQVHVSEDGSIVKMDNNRRANDVSTGIAGLFAGTQLKDTPAAVQETIKREVRDGRIADIDKERRTGRVVYEVEVEGAQGQFQLHIAEDGSVVKDERVAE